MTSLFHFWISFMINDLIKRFEKAGIGMSRNERVVLEPHNSAWPQVFEAESNRIAKKLNCLEFEFYHIGSTAIQGIKAKPILDMLITVPEIDLFDRYQSFFEDLGYECKGEYGISGRRYCVLYNEDKTKGYVHIHTFDKKHFETQRHLAFRDYLNSHPKIAKDYEELKVKLSSELKTSRVTYTESKSALIQKILSDALIWKNQNF